MMEVFGRPDNTKDVLVILAAISTLIDHCSSSFALVDSNVALREMESWLSSVPEHFHYMVSQRNPAALVVMAHWAATLIRWAERCGCWFLKGSARAILRYVERRLPKDDHVVSSLIEGLL